MLRGVYLLPQTTSLCLLRQKMFVLMLLTKKAQLSAGGVSFHGQKLKWDEVQQCRNAINNYKNLCKISGGSFRITEGCHLVCETRQFYDFAKHVSQKAFHYYRAADTEKVSLCNQLASWCVLNSK